MLHKRPYKVLMTDVFMQLMI